MSAPNDDAAKYTRKLAWRFTGLLLLIAVLQVVSLLAVLAIDAARERSRLHVGVAAAQETRAQEYEHATYLALVGLSAGDWEMLLTQRSAAVQISEAFEKTTETLLAGGTAHVGGAEVELRRRDEPELVAALTAVSASWDEMVAAHVRVLRSDNRSLKGNPDLERFRSASQRLLTELGDISGMLQRRSGSELRRFDLLQRFIPVSAFLLSALMGLFVLQRLILPLGDSLSSLRKSEGELRLARDELERRIEERTAELARTNEDLRHQTEILDSMLQNMGDGVLVTDIKGRFVLRNAMASLLLGLDHGSADVDGWRESHGCFMADGTTPFPSGEMPLLRAVRGEAPEQVEMLIQSLERPKAIWLSVTGRPLYRADSSLRGSVMVFRDVTVRKQAEAALRAAHDELEARVRERTRELRDAQRRSLDLARQAGMAELATNILHNVGNVLNSINTSSTVLAERLGSLRVDSLSKLASVLEEHRSDLLAFLSTDERGRLLPSYMGRLGQQLVTDRDEMLEVVQALHRHVEHIRTIVDLQQSYATSSSFLEVTSLEELVEDALRISAAALGRHHVVIERHVEQLPPLLIDKHRVLQILLNLISNAKYALEKNNADDRRLTLRVERTSDHRVRIEVRDNGVGIEPELLTKIFQHGFTTRKEGHGFGLHSSALVARLMGGQLEVHSDGAGKGALFELVFPYRLAAPGDA